MHVMRYVVSTTLFTCLALPVQAHMVVPLDKSQPFNPWLVDPFAVVLLAIVAGIYWRGSRRLPRRTGGERARVARRQGYFWGAWIMLVIALASPLDPLGEQLFAAHMVQHELMMLVAAPLLVLSRPTSALLRGMGRSVARGAGYVARKQGTRRLWNLLVSPSGAWTIHAIGLWGWHIPFLFEAGLQSTWVHALQHFSFLWIGLLFWYALIRPNKASSAVGVIYLFTTAIHASLLGALLTFSPQVWYAPYIATAPDWGLSPLEDQQLGGLIMWMPAGVVFVAAGLWSLARTMRTSDSGTDSYQRRSSYRGKL